MSELAFDANGEPITFPAEAEELRVRRFRNPGMRGACEVVHDRDGAPLYAPIDAGYVEFRKLVDSVPGRYRLDPVDSTRRVIGNSTPAYITISEAARPQFAAGGFDDRDCVIRELARANADMTKTIADRFASVMQAAADLLRAADGAGLPRREPAAAAQVEPDLEEEDHELEDDEDDDESPDIAALIAQVLPAVQMWLSTRIAAKPAAVSPAAAPAPVPAPASVPATAQSGAAGEPSVAAGAAPPPPPGAATVGTGAAPAAEATADATDGGTRNAGLTSIGQMAHLGAIYSRLTQDERRIAELVVRRMPPEVRQQWIAELSMLAVDEAVDLVRSLMPKLRTRKDGEP